MDTINLRLPKHLLRQIDDQHLIERVFLEILAVVLNKPLITQTPTSNLKYGEHDQATRTVIYGSTTYGLRLTAQAIASGNGIHGERGHWEFLGLPIDVSLSGYHVLDLRGGPHNAVRLEYEVEDTELRTQVEQQFAAKLRKLIAGHAKKQRR